MFRWWGSFTIRRFLVGQHGEFTIPWHIEFTGIDPELLRERHERMWSAERASEMEQCAREIRQSYEIELECQAMAMTNRMGLARSIGYTDGLCEGRAGARVEIRELERSRHRWRIEAGVQAACTVALAIWIAVLYFHG